VRAQLLWNVVMRHAAACTGVFTSCVAWSLVSVIVPLSDIRFFVLVLSSWLMIGSYYCYDNPSALQLQLRAQFSNMSKSDFDLYFNLLCVNKRRCTLNFRLPNIPLAVFRPMCACMCLCHSYTVYSIPNIILPFFGGYFVDWFGARWMNVIFSSLITAGQLLFAVGDHMKSFPVMLVRPSLLSWLLCCRGWCQ